MTIRVLIADDSAFMRKLIKEFILEDPSLSVVGIAKNGVEAVRLTKELRPDVITMDVEMPELNGIDALIQIMKDKPTPIIMLSSITQVGAQETLRALQLGAVDFIPKPSGSISIDLYKIKEEITTKIKIAAMAKVKRASVTEQTLKTGIEFPGKRSVLNKSIDQVVAIGTSTGGPGALETILSKMPGDLPYPILVVQHMPPKFTHSLASRLNRNSQMKVVEATDRQWLESGTVYIAPGDYHMTVAEKDMAYQIILHQRPQRNGHRPSVDEMFESVSKLKNLRRHFVLLTGMGKDGAREMANARRDGATSTIAESEETCVVFGMPRTAIELGGVDFILPLHDISEKILVATQAL